jgi:putative effector of murein hydrolase
MILTSDVIDGADRISHYGWYNVHAKLCKMECRRYSMGKGSASLWCLVVVLAATELANSSEAAFASRRCRNAPVVVPANVVVARRPGMAGPIVTTVPLARRHCPTLPSPTTNRLHQSSLLAAAKLPSFKGPSQSDVQAITSAAAFVALDIAFRRLFRAWSIAFPSSLGACTVLFVTLLSLPQNAAQGIFGALQPGAALLAKWLPVFFVPSLIALPLADSVGSALEMAKIALVIVAGFSLTLLTTAFSVTAVRRLKSNPSKNDSPINVATTTANVVDIGSPPPPPVTTVAKPPFTDELFHFLCASTAISAAGTIFIATTAPPGVSMVHNSPWLGAFLLCTTLNSFVFGARLPTQFKTLVHPLVTCTALTWTAMAALGVATRTTFFTLLSHYTVRATAATARGTTMGAGNILLFLLGPAVVSLAVSMYERRRLMRENLAEVGTAIGVSTAGGLVGTALAVRWLNLASPFLRLSLLSRNITSPLAMAIAKILGADVSLAVSMVVVTGLIGANFGASILDAARVTDPVARGLGIGAAAHGLGTAAFANEKDAFPFAAIAMALTATAATVAVSIPLLRNCLIRLALGV